MISQLFQNYATFDDENNNNRNGIGLGLVIVKKLIEILGPNGKIEVDSQLNVGSEFKFLIY